MKQHEIIVVNCPTCQKSIEWSDKYPYRPFCSKRCQLIDLGEWASESHRIATNEVDEQDIWSEDEAAQFIRNDD